MAVPDLVAGGAYVLGGLAMAGGIGHWIAVTGVAIRARRGYDVRLADMLAIGFLPFFAGLLMIVGHRMPAPHGPRLLAVTATVFVGLLAILWPVLSRPPEGNKPGAAAVLVVYGTFAALTWLV